MFPSEQLGTGEPWTTLSQISTTEYLNYEGGKFSKSRSIGVFGDDVQKTNISIEVWRYYLLSNRPETQDSNFYWNDFANRNNNELLNNLGNLCNRTLKFVQSAYHSIIPQCNELSAAEHELINDINQLITQYIAAMESIELRTGLRIGMELSTRCNKYVQDCKAWDEYKSNRSRADTIISISCNCIGIVAVVLEPFMPSFSYKVYQQLNYSYRHNELQTHDNTNQYQFKLQLPAQQRIGTIFPIFRRIDDVEIDRLRTEFNEKSDIPVLGLSLCIAYIQSITIHPKIKSMYICQIDCGAQETKQVVMNGISKYYTVQQLINKPVVYLNNIIVQNYKGVESYGTLLTGVKGTTHIGLLTINTRQINNNTNIPSGSIVTLKNCIRNILDTPFDIKSEMKGLPFTINDSGIVCYKNQSFIIDHSDITICIDNYDTKTSKGWTIQ